jgi:hypothetical protein
MNFFTILLTVIGLALFEIITSIDNAIINAEVLTSMSAKAKKWFLTWGIFFAVFLMRGLLPFLILYVASPQLGVLGTLTAAHVAETVKESSNVLLIAGGIFLIFLFLHWLFLEPKQFGLKSEQFFQKQGAWFYATVSILLSSIVWLAFRMNEPILEFGAVVGSTAFFIIHGFRTYAEEQEEELLSGGMSDFAKLAYLEVLDASFSIDGVIGAFAFTFAIPLILLGNGIGAVVIREITVRNVDRIKEYKYLKNGAMYSILILGIVMLLHSFGIDVPEWVSPIATFGAVGYFFYLSRREMSSKNETRRPSSPKKKREK